MYLYLGPNNGMCVKKKNFHYSILYLLDTNLLLGRKQQNNGEIAHGSDISMF